MTEPVRIPADVDMQDRLLGPLTARQLAILAVTGLVLYTVWTTTSTFLPIAVFLAVAAPVAAAAAVLALGQRDGISMDRLLIAAVRQRLAPRRYASAPEEAVPVPPWLAQAVDRHNSGAGPVSGETPLPGRDVTGSDLGVIDLGADGLAVLAAASTVNFALRTPEEQDALVSMFSRYLHSLTAPVQILVRAHRLDLSEQITELRDEAAHLAHPALRTAARDHADFLAELGQHDDLLRRQVLLVLREPTSAQGPTGGPAEAGPSSRFRRDRRPGTEASGAARRAAQARLSRRMSEAIELLAPAGITVTPLTPEQAVAVLRTACNPDSFLPPSAALAGPGEPITAGHRTVAELSDGWDEDLPEPLADRPRPTRRRAA